MSLAVVLTFTFLIFSSSITFAADASHCLSIEDADSRLSCYDLEYGRSPTTEPSAGDWLVQTQKNPIDDSQTTFVGLEAEQGSSRWGEPVYLVIRCKSNKTEMWINWEDYLGSDRIMVTTRIGDQEAETRPWSLSTDKKSSFYLGSPIGFIKRMMGADSFVAQTTPYNENPVTAVFNTSGLESAIEPLRANCSW